MQGMKQLKKISSLKIQKKNNIFNNKIKMKKLKTTKQPISHQAGIAIMATATRRISQD